MLFTQQMHFTSTGNRDGGVAHVRMATTLQPGAISKATHCLDCAAHQFSHETSRTGGCVFQSGSNLCSLYRWHWVMKSKGHLKRWNLSASAAGRSLGAEPKGCAFCVVARAAGDTSASHSLLLLHYHTIALEYDVTWGYSSISNQPESN